MPEALVPSAAFVLGVLIGLIVQVHVKTKRARCDGYAQGREDGIDQCANEYLAAMGRSQRSQP